MRKKIVQQPDEKEPSNSPIEESLSLTSAINKPVPTPSINPSDLAAECLQILMNIARDKNVSPRSRESAAKTVVELLDKTKQFLTPEMSNILVSPIEQKQKELEEAKKLLRYRKDLAHLEDRHLLPPNHPLYEGEDTPEIKRYRGVWKVQHPHEPYPESEKELSEWYNQFMKQIEQRTIVEAEKRGRKEMEAMERKRKAEIQPKNW